jgi:uncharacterized integral membrane protein
MFIVQNRAPTVIRFLGWAGTLPLGVALLLAAVSGVLLVAIPGIARRPAAQGHAPGRSAAGPLSADARRILVR